MSKWIKGLENKVTGPKGVVLKDQLTGKDGIMCDLIIGALYVAKSKDAVEAVRKQNKLFPMLTNAKNALELEDADYEIIKRSVEENPEDRPDGVWGQMLMIFEENKPKE